MVWRGRWKAEKQEEEQWRTQDLKSIGGDGHVSSTLHQCDNKATTI